MVPGRTDRIPTQRIVMRRIPDERASSCPTKLKRVSRTLLAITAFTLAQSSARAVQNINLVWNPSPDASVTGYAVYSGTNSGSYGTRFEAGNQTALTVSNLAAGVSYYFVAT